MEGMARLALVEQSVRDVDKFNNILYELLRHINHILENPHDYQLRTINSSILKDYKKIDAFCEYLKYIGFESKDDNFVYPTISTLSSLRMAQVVIERKISICCGVIDPNQISVQSSQTQYSSVKIQIQPANVLTTSNRFLLKVQDLFNNMLQYEDPELLAYAREHIPLVTLQIKALDRMREHQRQIKAGETKTLDLPYDISLLMELMGWFKYQFFKWVDAPSCHCGGESIPAGGSMQKSRGEMCRVELYKCKKCSSWVTFPRYNNPRTLLQWRRGRCGEWANCFTLICRALGYDVRYVYDVTDHVWCEVFDYDSNTWLHCDPCECKLNAPLIYSNGWGKKLSYVIAVSRDDLQDVTWRYTTQHDEVRSRRKECSERELIECIVSLRQHRQRQGSEARRQYLAKRTAQELVHLMVERKPEDYESHGRISGSQTWRESRGETGTREPYTFQLTQRGLYNISYNCAQDKYRIHHDGAEKEPVVITTWASGAHDVTRVFRKVEHDWKQIYLAREEGATTGEITWKLSASSGLTCKQFSIKASSAVFENAKTEWTLAFDGEEPLFTYLGESTLDLNRTFSSVTVRCVLSGGSGALAWQHAQLFRQPADADTPVFILTVRVE